MLKRTRQITWAAIALCFFASFAFAVWNAASYQHEQRAISQSGKNAEHTASFPIVEKSAEERIADYTWWLGAFTFALAIVSSFQIFFLTRADRMAVRASELSRQSLIYSQRAFVFLNEFNRDFTYSAGTTVMAAKIIQMVVKPQWKNSGSTPPVNLRIKVNWGAVRGDLPDDFGYPYTAPPTFMLIGPSAVEWSDRIEIPVDVLEATRRDETRLYIWGRADYRDVFADTNRHFTEFCYRILIAGKPLQRDITTQFIAYGTHNRSDDGEEQKPKRRFERIA